MDGRERACMLRENEGKATRLCTMSKTKSAYFDPRRTIHRVEEAVGGEHPQILVDLARTRSGWSKGGMGKGLHNPLPKRPDCPRVKTDFPLREAGFSRKLIGLPFQQPTASFHLQLPLFLTVPVAAVIIIIIIADGTHLRDLFHHYTHEHTHTNTNTHIQTIPHSRQRCTDITVRKQLQEFLLTPFLRSLCLFF